ncbi:DUF4240 domain-containing protein [Actinomadura adrarensis]|uniref:DUF4240 domain-containing protein n=1 Tax=Actinomadura adrarensis TaxID=1819600 RepID=A0ABW3CNM1_9ACTN
MRMDEFWTLVEQAREDAVEGGGPWPSGDAVGAALADRLARLPLERILEFDHCFRRVFSRAHQWALCAAAYVIWDYISDDGFADFKAGLVGLGEEAFTQVVADPDALAEHPMVLAIASGEVSRFSLSAEAFQFAASTAYGRVTGDEELFWEALHGRVDREDGNRDEQGERWSGRFGSAEDVDLIPVRLPRLHALFRGEDVR